jgi:Ala-tRNA(Pro) deacylase
MTVRDLLDRREIPYRWLTHEPTFTTQDLAHAVHRSGHVVIKPVLFEADGEMVLCAVPAPAKVDEAELRDALDAHAVRQASELQMKRVFKECELGAEPPIGSLFKLKTVMDDSLGDKLYVTFQAGTHTDAVTISLRDFVELADPIVAHITRD